MTSRQRPSRPTSVEDPPVEEPEGEEEDCQGKSAAIQIIASDGNVEIVSGRNNFDLRTFTVELLVQTSFAFFFLFVVILGLRHGRSMTSAGATTPLPQVTTPFRAAVPLASVRPVTMHAAVPLPSSVEESMRTALRGARMEPMRSREQETMRTAPREPSIEALVASVASKRGPVRAMKATKVDMTKDPASLALTGDLQNASLALLKRRYGPGPTYLLEMVLAFPEIMGGGEATLHIETAPNWMMPHAVHIFLDAAVTKFKSAAFHRNAGHVLQAFVRAPKSDGLAFQEYDARFPHEKYTLGFAGRPGGPEFYISTQDNTDNHGPGSQGSKTEADACFATVLPASRPIVDRMSKQPAPKGGAGFINDKAGHIVIKSFTLLP